MLVDDGQHLRGVLKPGLGFIPGDLANEFSDALGYGVGKIKRRIGLVKRQFAHNGCFGETGIRSRLGQHFIHHEPQTVEIAAQGQQFAFGTFRRQIGQWSQDVLFAMG